MTHRTWEEAPAEVRHAVEALLEAPVIGSISPTAGRSSDLSMSVVTEDATVFVKGVLRETRRAWAHRNEVRVNRMLPPGVAPRLLWEVETPEWLVLGFENVTGRHADFAPGSPDLPLVAKLLMHLTGQAPIGDTVELRRFADSWAQVMPWHTTASNHRDSLIDWEAEHLDSFLTWETRFVEMLRNGRYLAHSDLHQLNVLISGGQAQLIDWAWGCRAPRWLDPALAVMRLIGAGHRPGVAEEWARQIPAWCEASADELTACAVSVYGMWRYRARFPQLVDAARQYVRYRFQ